jgi:hypothetical protein
VRGDGVKRCVDQVAIHDVTRLDDPDAALVEATLRELLHEIATLAARQEKVMASGLASFIRGRNGAKSGFFSGTLTSSTISPPAAMKCAP